MAKKAIISLEVSVVFLLVYLSILIFGFDDEPAYNDDFTDVRFDFSPKWVTRERYPYGPTNYGRRATIWNYLFYPRTFFK